LRPEKDEAMRTMTTAGLLWALLVPPAAADERATAAPAALGTTARGALHPPPAARESPQGRSAPVVERADIAPDRHGLRREPTAGTPTATERPDLRRDLRDLRADRREVRDDDRRELRRDRHDERRERRRH
jgi:hypothetical protein